MVPIEARQGASSESQVNLDRVLKEDNQCEGGWFVGKLQQQKALWRRMDFAVPQRWYGKVQAGLPPISDVQEKKKEKKKEGGCCTRRASSCLYMLCTLSMLGVVSISPQ
jgi:hypothetical protein